MEEMGGSKRNSKTDVGVTGLHVPHCERGLARIEAAAIKAF